MHKRNSQRLALVLSWPQFFLQGQLWDRRIQHTSQSSWNWRCYREVAWFTVVLNEGWRSKWNFLVCHHCTTKNISINCIHSIRIRKSIRTIENFPAAQRIYCLVELPEPSTTGLGLRLKCNIKRGKGHRFGLEGLRLWSDCIEQFSTMTPHAAGMHRITRTCAVFLFI